MADAPKKPKTTAEILAAARRQDKPKGDAPAQEPPAANEPVAEPVASSAPEPAPPAPVAAEAPAPQPAAPKPAGAKPKSTADILAAARAAKAGGAAPVEPSAEAPAAAAEKPAAAKPAAGAAGKPKSTADILAAARAGKAAAAGASPAAENAPAAKPAAATAKPAASTAGLSVDEMLARVRPAAVPVAKVAAPAKAVLAPPPLPPRPTPVKKKDDVPRRGFFDVAVALVATPFALAWTLFAGWTAMATLFTARFMLPNVLAEPPRKFKIGSPNDYDLGTVATKLVAAFGVWIVHTEQYQGRNIIYALASVCTHLGCTPSWLEGEQKFKCPCHGSGFYITGINFEGPAPRPLERVGLRIAEDGMLEVNKSLKFQEEMGQWSDPNSFVEIA